MINSIIVLLSDFAVGFFICVTLIPIIVIVILIKMRVRKKLRCKIFGHEFYMPVESPEKIQCEKCGEWFKTNEAYGKWI